MSRLDLRVGRILNARRHPLAATLTVQEVDVGESAPRRVISKLGGKTQLDEVRRSLLIIVNCNRPSDSNWTLFMDATVCIDTCVTAVTLLCSSRAVWLCCYAT